MVRSQGFNHGRMTSLLEFSGDALADTDSDKDTSENVDPELGTIIKTECLNVQRIECVRRHKLRRDGLYYLVKWKGLPESSNSWTSEISMLEGHMTSELVGDYHKAESGPILQRDAILPVTVLSVDRRNGERFYMVQYGDGPPRELTSCETRVKHPEELLDYLEKTVVRDVRSPDEGVGGERQTEQN
jgi:hypothetical protein